MSLTLQVGYTPLVINFCGSFCTFITNIFYLDLKPQPCHRESRSDREKLPVCMATHEVLQIISSTVRDVMSRRWGRGCVGVPTLGCCSQMSDFFSFCNYVLVADLEKKGG